MKRRIEKLFNSIAIAVVLSLVMPWSAFADELVGDGDGLAPVTGQALNLGNINYGASATKTVLFAIQRNSANNAFGKNENVTLSAGTPNQTSVSTSVIDAGMKMTGNWDNSSVTKNGDMSADTASASVTVSAVGAECGAKSATIIYTAKGESGVTRNTTLNISWTVVNCAVNTTLTVASPSVVYGATSTSLSATLTRTGGSAVSGKDVSFSLTEANNTVTNLGTATTGSDGVASLPLALGSRNVGTYNISASFSGDTASSPSLNASTGSGNLAITQANATINVSGFTGTFDGNAHGATGSATGVKGENLGSLLHLGSSFTDYPGGTANWTFDGNTNYKPAAGTASITINKANATVSVQGYNGAYDGNSHGATGTATGLNSSNLSSLLDLGATYSDVPGGTANWKFAGNTNYNADSGSVNISIGKADATIKVDGYSGIYDGSAHAATGIATGVKGENLGSLLHLGSSYTNAGTYTINWTFDGNGNYNAKNGSVEIAIAKANPTIDVKGYSGIYDGNAHAATGTAKGVKGEDLSSLLDLGTSFTDALGGTANWSFAGNGNYNAKSGSVDIEITKANATVSVSGYEGVYDGNAHTATGTAKGVKNEDLSSLLTISGSFTNGGTHQATWSFAGNNNYNADSGTATIQIDKAVASTVVNGYSGTYDGNAHGATGSAQGIKGEDLSSLLSFGQSFTNVPGGTASWSFAGNANYQATDGEVAIQIAQADAIITVNGFSGDYDGNSHGATGSAKGVKGENLSSLLHLGDSFTNVPGGTASWSFDGNTNYRADGGSVGITINKADATLEVKGATVDYDGNIHGATGSAKGVKGENLGSLLHLGDSFTDVPGGTANWSFDGNGNYNAAAGSVAITINKADAAIDVNGAVVDYDGNAHGATGTAKGVKGEDLSNLLNLGVTFTDVPGGSASWSFAGNSNYNPAAGTVDININKVNATTTVSGYTGNYDGSAHGATGSSTGVKGENLSSLLTLGASFTDAPGGAAKWTFAGNTNYNADSGTVDITINKISATVHVDGYAGEYDGNAHGATGTAKGLNTIDLSSLLNLGETFKDVPGGLANWLFAGDTNYNADSGSVMIAIGPGNARISVDGYEGVYDGNSHGATGTATGASGEDLSSLLHLGQSFTDAGTHSVTWTFDGNNNYKPATGTTTVKIAKANATITVDGYSDIYDGNPHGATGSATGVKNEDLSDLLSFGQSFTNVPGGTANWSFAGNGNYNAESGSANIAIAKANALIAIDSYTGAYDGNAHGASGTATGVKGENLGSLLSLGVTFTNVPGGTASWSFAGNGNYNGANGSANIKIDKTNANVNVASYTGTYDGDAHGASGTATGVKGENLGSLLNLGATFTDAPGGTANWSFAGNGNYNAVSGSADIVIGKANATIKVDGYSGTYDTAAHGATGTAAGVKGENLSALLSLGDSFPNTGTYTVNWSFAGNGNYNAANGTANIIISQASQVISFGALSNKTFGDPAFAVSATGGASGNPVTFSASGNCTVAGSTVTLTSKGNCTITAAQAGSSNYLAAASVPQSFTINGWNLNGFYSPVDGPKPDGSIVWNTVKNGSTVPLKFNIFGTVERTSTSDVTGFTQTKVTCSTAPEDVVTDSFLTTGGTSLRYSGTPGVDGQFIQNWQTPKTAGVCYKVVMTARDNSTITAYFKLK